MKKYINYLLLISILVGCSDKRHVLMKSNDSYTQYKKMFSDSLLNHFPKEIEHIQNGMVATTNEKKNDIGLLLFESGLKDNEIDSLEKEINSVAIAVYDSKKECLLIVNRYETQETYESYQTVIIPDSVSVEKDCYKGLYPIPNFKRFSYTNSEFNLKKAKIYVLEAKPQKVEGKFKLNPNNQMPNQWKNGYSRGIAIDKEEKTIIYWLVEW